MKNPTKVGIVDDDATCIAQLKLLLDNTGIDFELIFEEQSVQSARETLSKNKVDLLFLDIELGDGIGFDLMECIPAKTRIIFVTGWDQFAVRAFEVNALDYLLKPVQPHRLERALSIFKDDKKRNATLQPLTENDVILMRDGGSSEFVKTMDILYIESDKDYTLVVTAKKSWFIKRSLSSWERILPITIFLRVHRSCIVNFKRVNSVSRETNGQYSIVIESVNRTIKSSRRHASRLKRFLV